MLPVREIVVNIDVDGSICDSEAARLLPWFASGRLSATDAERVTQHLEHCEICAADLVEQRSLRATLKAGGSVEYAPQAGLARTLARIDELTREAAPAPDDSRAERDPKPRRRGFGATQWLTAAVIVQAIGLGAIGGSFLVRPAGDRTPARYETLSSPAPVANGARIRAVFSVAMTIGQLKTLLAAQHLLIVEGPTEAGVFTLGVADVASDHARLEVLAGLRADPHVLFAEPVPSDRGPP
jgi:anti-sigma factor RsiW